MLPRTGFHAAIQVLESNPRGFQAEGSGAAAVFLRDRIVVGRECEGRESDAFGERGLALTGNLAGQEVWKFSMVQQEGVAQGEGRVWKMVYCYYRYS